MKRSLMFAAALSAFAVPAAAMAQDEPAFRSREDVRAARRAEAAAASPAPSAPASSPPRQERSEERRERRQEASSDQSTTTTGSRRGRGGNRGDGAQQQTLEERAQANPDRPIYRNRQDVLDARAAEARGETWQPRDGRSGRRGDRDDRQGQGDRQQTLEERAQANPNRPLYRDRQDVLDARAAEARGETWQPRNDRSDRRRGDRDGRRDYRDYHQRFDSDQWRRDYGRRYNSGWWRNDRRFRGYSGVRFGYYFAPSYGYYQVPSQYWGQRYYEGQFLPSIFWRYRLNDWRTYGLGYPPPGTRWVLVDNQIYLIDERDGYIIDVIYDAWTW